VTRTEAFGAAAMNGANDTRIVLGIVRVAPVRRGGVLVAYRRRRRQPVPGRLVHRGQEPALAAGELLARGVGTGGVHHGHQVVRAEPLDELLRRRLGSLDPPEGNVQIVKHEHVHAPLDGVFIGNNVGLDRCIGGERTVECLDRDFVDACLLPLGERCHTADREPA
jgi:hypothetical protein